jgi:hypothetical protein
MAVYRAYYGDALYGQNTYGLSGSITDGASIIIPDAVTTVSAVRVISFASTDTAAASVTAAAEVVKQGAAAVTPSASVAADGNRVLAGAASASALASTTSAADKLKDGAVAASLQNIVVSVAETYAETDGYRDGYGLRTYGTFVYGENYSIEEATITASASASVSINYERVRGDSFAITPSTTFTSNGVIDVVGRATITPALSVDIAYNRVRLMAASDDVTLTTDVNARYKWLDADDPTTIWTDAPDPSDTWTDADYLERAA